MFRNNSRIRTAWAFVICMFGTALIDHALLALKPKLTSAGDGRIDTAQLERLQQFLNVKPFAEVSLITAIAFVAFYLSRPNGFRKNEYPLILLVIASMTLGRSILGIGEGFSTDFLLTALPGTIIGFVVFGLVRTSRSIP